MQNYLDEDIDVKTVEDYLNSICYDVDPSYVPSQFALEFVNFMKLVDGGENENKTQPPIICPYVTHDIHTNIMQ